MSNDVQHSQESLNPFASPKAPEEPARGRLIPAAGSERPVRLAAWGFLFVLAAPHLLGGAAYGEPYSIAGAVLVVGILVIEALACLRQPKHK